MPEALAHSWAAFIDNWNKDPAQCLSRLTTVRTNFRFAQSVASSCRCISHVKTLKSIVQYPRVRFVICVAPWGEGQYKMKNELVVAFQRRSAGFFIVLTIRTFRRALESDSKPHLIPQSLRDEHSTPSEKLSKTAFDKHNSTSCAGGQHSMNVDKDRRANETRQAQCNARNHVEFVARQIRHYPWSKIIPILSWTSLDALQRTNQLCRSYGMRTMSF